MVWKFFDHIVMADKKLSLKAQLADVSSASDFYLYLFLGIALGSSILYAANRSAKWLSVVAFLFCIPLLIKAFSSSRKLLLAFLLVSFSVRMRYNPWLSFAYQHTHPGIPITITALVLVAIYGVWCFDISKKDVNVYFFPSVTVPFILIVTYSGLSALLATDSSYVIAGFPYVLEALLAYFCAANFLRTQKDIDFIVKCIVFVVTLTALVGVCQYLFGTTLNLTFLGSEASQSLQEYDSVTLSRVSGFLGHPNSLGIFLVGLLPVVFMHAIAAQKRSQQFVCLISFALGSTALILSYSRNSWAAFVITLMLIMALLLKRTLRRNIKGAIVRSVLILFLGLVCALPVSNSIIARLSKDDYGSAYSRLPMAYTALRVIRDHPLTGVGLGNYGSVVAHYDPNPFMRSDGIPHPVHNIYLLTAAELGIPVLGLLIWLLISFFRSGLICLQSDCPSSLLLGLGLFAGIIASSVNGLYDHGGLGQPLFVNFAFRGGLLIGLARWCKENNNSYSLDCRNQH